jgi:hypothetical protein
MEQWTIVAHLTWCKMACLDTNNYTTSRNRSANTRKRTNPNGRPFNPKLLRWHRYT